MAWIWSRTGVPWFRTGAHLPVLPAGLVEFDAEDALITETGRAALPQVRGIENRLIAAGDLELGRLRRDLNDIIVALNGPEPVAG